MANPPLPKKTPSPKGKPMGIPIWGWVIAAIIGIVIGYTILKQSKRTASGFASDGGPNDSGFLPESEQGSPGGTIALPEKSLAELLAALGLYPAAGGGSLNNQQTTDESSAQEAAESAATQESISDPVVQELINQGVPIAPEGTTVDFQGTTYDVSGTPEFSPNNFNPNSPAGVLAMNQALGLTSTSTPMPGSTPVTPPDFYTADNAAVAAAQPYVTPGGPHVAV